MNEGENSAMPTQEPVFSVPDNSQTFQPQQPQMMNYGAAPTMSLPLVSDDNLETPKKGIRKRLIAIGLLIIIVITAGLALLLASRGVVNQIKLTNAQKAWNKVGNYIFYGEEKEDKLDVNSATAAAIIYSRGVFAGNDDTVKRSKRIAELRDEAMKVDSSSDFAEMSSSIDSMVRLYEIQPVSPIVFYMSSMLRGETADTLKAEASSYYDNNLLEQNSTLDNEIIEYLKEASYSKIAITAQYYANNCYVEGTLDGDCMDKVNNLYPDIMGELKRNEAMVRSRAETVYKYFFDCLKELNEEQK